MDAFTLFLHCLLRVGESAILEIVEVFEAFSQMDNQSIVDHVCRCGLRYRGLIINHLLICMKCCRKFLGEGERLLLYGQLYEMSFVLSMENLVRRQTGEAPTTRSSVLTSSWIPARIFQR
jgi:hypothetical protein